MIGLPMRFFEMRFDETEVGALRQWAKMTA
jgi:hypothetical protein